MVRARTLATVVVDMIGDSEVRSGTLDVARTDSYWTASRDVVDVVLPQDIAASALTPAWDRPVDKRGPLETTPKGEPFRARVVRPPRANRPRIILPPPAPSRRR